TTTRAGSSKSLHVCSPANRPTIPEPSPISLTRRSSSIGPDRNCVQPPTCSLVGSEPKHGRRRTSGHEEAICDHGLDGSLARGGGLVVLVGACGRLRTG